MAFKKYKIKCRIIVATFNYNVYIKEVKYNRHLLHCGTSQIGNYKVVSCIQYPSKSKRWED